MKITARSAGIFLGAAAFAIVATSASAEIVCNREGECWHVNRHYEYRPEFGLASIRTAGSGVRASIIAGTNIVAAVIGTTVFG